MLTVNSNQFALFSAASATSAQATSEKSIERLSTGVRINSARDDVAGVSISSHLQSEIRGMNQSIRNALDVIAFLDVIDTAYAAMEETMQGARELLIQAKSDTYSDADRKLMQAEYDGYLAEFDKIGKSTSYAGEYPLVGEDEVVGVTLNGDPYRRNMYSFQLGTGGSSNHAIVVPVYEMHVAILGHNTRLLDLSNPLTGSLDWWIENRIDWALQTLRISRSAYGSLSNAMDHVVSNLANQSMNLAVSQSKINDADFALETTNLAKQQIMVQAGTAMLAQASASKSSVLALLQA